MNELTLIVVWDWLIGQAKQCELAGQLGRSQLLNKAAALVRAAMAADDQKEHE